MDVRIQIAGTVPFREVAFSDCRQERGLLGNCRSRFRASPRLRKAVSSSPEAIRPFRSFGIARIAERGYAQRHDRLRAARYAGDPCERIFLPMRAAVRTNPM